jgi:hypothetical protein
MARDWRVLALRGLQRLEFLHQPGIVRSDLLLEHVVEPQRRGEVEQVVFPPVAGEVLRWSSDFCIHCTQRERSPMRLPICRCKARSRDGLRQRFTGDSATLG